MFLWYSIGMIPGDTCWLSIFIFPTPFLLWRVCQMTSLLPSTNYILDCLPLEPGLGSQSVPVEYLTLPACYAIVPIHQTLSWASWICPSQGVSAYAFPLCPLYLTLKDICVYQLQSKMTPIGTGSPVPSGMHMTWDYTCNTIQLWIFLNFKTLSVRVGELTRLGGKI